MKHNSTLNKLHGAKDETLEQLAAQAPADWDMDAVFDQSYRKFLAQTGGEEPAAESITAEVKPARSRWMGWLMTAACMAIACGTVGTMFFLHRSAPAQQSIHETETQTVTTSASETAAFEETEQVTDATQAPVIVVPASETDPAETRTTEALPSETVRDTAPAESSAAQATEAATQKATDPQRPAETQKQTDPPEPATTEPDMTPIPNEEPTTTEPDKPGDGSTDASAPDKGETSALIEQKEGSVFKIERKNNGIYFTGAGPDLPFVEGEPTVGNENFTFERFAEGDVYTKHYNLKDQTTGSTYTLHLFRYNGFSMMNFTDNDPNGGFKEHDINGREGYLGEGSMFWDHDGGIALLTYVPDDEATAQQIAENLTFG